MSGGGGTNTVTQTIPSWMADYIGNTYTKAEGVSSMPFQQFGGQAIAPLNPTQQAGATQLANSGQANTGAAAAQSGVNAATGATGYTPTNVNYASPTAQGIQQYLSPYLGQVQQTTNQALMNQNDIENQQTAAGATAAGAYGGSRQGVQTALNNYYTGQNIAQADANIANTGYSTALSAAQQDAQANLAAQEANQNAGLTGNQQKITGGMVLGQLGGEQQGIGANNASNVIQAGSLSQQEQQALDTYNYQQYMQQLMWPYQQLSALEGATYQGNAGGSTSSPLYSNTLGQVAGLGMAGLGLAGSMGWLGSGAAAAGGAAAGGGAGTALAEGAMLLA